jgi:hypothetical protein
MSRRVEAVSFLRAMLAALALLAPGSRSAAQDWFVDASAPAGGDGKSWPTAFDHLQDALALATSGEEIWVAQGVYAPTFLSEPPDPRSATFLLPGAVRIYGGFQGGEATLERRAGLFDQTVLSGDLGVAGDPADNAYHVVRMLGAPQVAPTVLDGFTIRDGSGLVPGGAQRKGGGVHLTGNGPYGPVLELGNCRVRDNRAESGGGIAALDLASLFMRDCIVRDNRAQLNGGGLFALTSWAVRAYNTTWVGNSAQGDGGAVFLNSTAPDSIWFVNGLFHSNRAERGAAAMLKGGPFTSGAGKWFQCTVAFNQAVSEGGGFHADPSSAIPPKLHVSNSILWGNTLGSGASEQIFGAGNVQRTLVEGGWPGAGNLAGDPLFVDPAAGDLRTAQGSPAHDSASNLLVPFDLFDFDGDGLAGEPVPRDLDGNLRFGFDPWAAGFGVGWPGQDGVVVDMGAYEF